MRWTILLLVALSKAALAEPDHYEAKVAMEDYYDGESYGGYVLDGMGVLGIVGGGFLYTDGGDRERGASYVAMGIGVAHLGAGIYISIASALRKGRLSDAPAVDWGAKEHARATKVERQLFALRIAEGVLIASGATIAIVGNTTDRPKLEGAGYALATAAAATLVFDVFAGRRACGYRRAMRPYVAGTSAGVSVQF